jgi:hypothetical protein
MSEERKHESLKTELSSLAERADRHWRRERARAAMPEAIEKAMPLLLVVPALLLLVQLALAAAGKADLSRSVFLFVLATLAPFAVVLLVRSARMLSQAVPRRDALSLVDQEFRLQDRLSSADEFLSVQKRTSFMEAAVEDAEEHARRLREQELKSRATVVPMRARAWTYPVLGAAVLVAALLVRAAQPAASGEDGKTQTTARAEASTKRENERERAPERTPQPAQAKEKPPEVKGGGRPDPTQQARERDVAKEEKRSEGMTKSGQSSSAAAPSGSASAKGQPTSQSQESKGEQQKSKVQRKPREEKTKPEKPGERKETKESSGSTMSRGSAGGSTKNPVASEWNTKDEIQMPEEEKSTDDEDVEDESTDDEARGGVQPNLRDRRPPVNRDLALSWGNDPGGDGRGGPGEQKKSRGVASLVLGIPIPDHVKGQINPGTTKITQERVQPKTEDFDALIAAAQEPRSGLAGNVSDPSMDPAVRQVLRRYYLKLRNRSRVD